MTERDNSFDFDLFLSHNRADKDWSRYLAERIEADTGTPRLRVFLDEWYIEPGDNLVMALEEALTTSNRVALVMSPESFESTWVGAERSVAFYRDPTSRHKTLIPLLRRDCTIPALLQPIAALDFRDPNVFEDSLLRLLRVLRNQRPPRTTSLAVDDLKQREDHHLIRQYRIIFERPAFSTPCISELSLEELSRAIDDCLAGVNTGAVYSRQGLILRTLAPRNDFQTTDVRDALGRMVEHLATLRHTIQQMKFHSDPTASDGMPFFMVRRDITAREAVELMDKVDMLRNAILTELNVLLVQAGTDPFPLIDLSSVCIERAHAHPRYGKLALSVQHPSWSEQQLHSAWVHRRAEIWVNERGGQWDHDDWLKLKDHAKCGRWNLSESELGNLVESLKKRFQEQRTNNIPAEN